MATTFTRSQLVPTIQRSAGSHCRKVGCPWDFSTSKFSQGPGSINDPYYNPFTEKRYLEETNKLGFYLCQKDQLSVDDLKLGTFEQASNFCRKIWTPHLCKNQKFDQELYSMADGLMFRVLTGDQSSGLTEMVKSIYFGSNNTFLSGDG